MGCSLIGQNRRRSFLPFPPSAYAGSNPVVPLSAIWPMAGAGSILRTPARTRFLPVGTCTEMPFSTEAVHTALTRTNVGQYHGGQFHSLFHSFTPFLHVWRYRINRRLRSYSSSVEEERVRLSRLGQSLTLPLRFKSSRPHYVSGKTRRIHKTWRLKVWCTAGDCFGRKRVIMPGFRTFPRYHIPPLRCERAVSFLLSERGNKACDTATLFGTTLCGSRQ